MSRVFRTKTATLIRSLCIERSIREANSQPTKQPKLCGRSHVMENGGKVGKERTDNRRRMGVATRNVVDFADTLVNLDLLRSADVDFMAEALQEKNKTSAFF